MASSTVSTGQFRWVIRGICIAMFVIISPLIAFTYGIDKGNQKSHAEYAVTHAENDIRIKMNQDNNKKQDERLLKVEEKHQKTLTEILNEIKGLKK